MGSSSSDDVGQQAMTAERLAEIGQRAYAPKPISMMPLGQSLADWIVAADTDRVALLADNERLRAALAAKTDSYERLHLINMQLVRISRARQADLVAVVERVATMLYIPLTNASGVTTREICGGCARTFRRDDSGWFSEDSRHAPECVVEQARALLASTEADVGEQAAQGEK